MPVNEEVQADIRYPPQSLFSGGGGHARECTCLCVCARVCVHVHACVSVCLHVVYVCRWRWNRSQKSVPDPLELELQAVVCRQNMGDGKWTLASERSASAVNYWAISQAPSPYFLSQGLLLNPELPSQLYQLANKLPSMGITGLTTCLVFYVGARGGTRVLVQTLHHWSSPSPHPHSVETLSLLIPLATHWLFPPIFKSFLFSTISPKNSCVLSSNWRNTCTA